VTDLNSEGPQKSELVAEDSRMKAWELVPQARTSLAKLIQVLIRWEPVPVWGLVASVEPT